MTTTPVPIKIDFVSDVACPWCAIGLASLDQAIANLDDKIAVEIHFQPFQLNPDMPPEGQDMTEHLTQKYGSTPEQQAENYERIRQRGAELGFEFKLDGRARTWNTFDCHRLLHWAGEQSLTLQKNMKQAMLKSYFTEGKNPADREVLLAMVEQLGMDKARAVEILDSDAYTSEVRQQQHFYQAQGIRSVPAIILNDRYLISGGQPPEVFQQALEQVAAEAQ